LARAADILPVEVNGQDAAIDMPHRCVLTTTPAAPVIASDPAPRDCRILPICWRNQSCQTPARKRTVRTAQLHLILTDGILDVCNLHS
jgi:hypothetical protein